MHSFLLFGSYTLYIKEKPRTPCELLGFIHFSMASHYNVAINC